MLRAARSTFLRHAALFAGMNAVATAWTPDDKEFGRMMIGGFTTFGATSWLAKRNPSGRAAAVLSGVFGLLRGFRPQLPAAAHAAVVGAALTPVQLVSYALDLPGLSARLQRERQLRRQQEAEREQEEQNLQGKQPGASAPTKSACASMCDPPLQPVLPLLTRQTMMRLRPGDTDWWFDTSLRCVGPGAAYYPPDHPLTAQAEAVRDQVLADALEEIEDSEGPGSAAAARFRQRFGSPGSLAVRVYSCPSAAAASFVVPHGIAVRDGADMAEAVEHGVYSTLQAAGVDSVYFNWDIDARGNWYMRMWALAYLWPWTLTSWWQIGVTSVAFLGVFPAYDPEQQLLHRLGQVWAQQHERWEQLAREGREEEVKELRRRQFERAERRCRRRLASAAEARSSDHSE